MRWCAVELGAVLGVGLCACSLVQPIDDGYALRPSASGGAGGASSTSGGNGGLGVGGASSAGGSGGMPDPVTLSFGERPGTDVSGVVDDTQLDVQSPGNNYGAYAAGWVDALSEERVTLLRFDLSDIPAGAIVQAAELSIFTNQASAAFSTGITEVHEVTEPWEVGTQNDAPGVANWDDRQAGVPWSSPGVGPNSHAAAVLGTIAPAQIETEYFVSLPAALVQGWVDVPADNDGLVLRTDDQDGAGYALSEHPVAAYRPTLTVTFVPPN